jgi:hypothetical protein
MYQADNDTDTDNSPNPTIKWEKWVDPFGENTGEVKWNQYGDDDDSEASMIFEERIEKHMPKQVRVIQTPMGIIPYNEHTSSSKIFNFWVGHTNFNISQSILDIIEDCPGVEILDPFTRYRFRIGVGKCFEDKEVMNNIQQQINNFHE